MLAACRQRKSGALAAVILAALSSWTFAQEEGRPAHELGKDEYREGMRKSEERPVTAIDRVGRERDLATKRDQEVLGVDGLEKIMKENEKQEPIDLKDMQRLSDSLADRTAQKLGYSNAHDLKGDFGAKATSDLFVDREKNVYLGNKLGDGEPEFVGKLKE